MRSLRWGIGGLGIAIAAFACSTSDREPPGGGLPMPPAAAGPGAGERSVPISGGTLLVLDSARVLASDPDRDRLVFASITGGGPHAVALEAGDEPGRAAVAPDGTVAVALRGADALLFTTSSGSILARVPTCRAPRGVAFDAADGAFHVACADGDLWSFDAGSHAPVRKLRVAEDLRDVIATGDRLLVSTFRSAEVFAVSRDGVVTGASRAASAGAEMVPTVAWRMQPLPGGGALMVHQSATSASIEIAPPTEGFDSPAYGGDLGSDDCEGAILVSATSVFDAEGNRVTAEGLARLGSLGLPVDIAVSPSFAVVAVVSAGNDQVVEVPAGLLGSSTCFGPSPDNHFATDPIAAAYVGEVLVVQQRSPSALVVFDGAPGEGPRTIPLGGGELTSQGHFDFHRVSGAVPGLSCASCHPEGRDDGHTWLFSDVGARRTQSLRGGVIDGGALHWGGEFTTFGALSREVAQRRMGMALEDERPLATWIHHLPPVSGRSGEASQELASPGRVAFEQAGCQACHAGERLDSKELFDVGTGGRFVVPSLLGVRFKAPLMHDGCATTVADRFDPACGGDEHGDLSSLTPEQITALIEYLESL